MSLSLPLRQLLALLLLSCLGGSAAQAAIYKCVDAQGRVAYTQSPCPETQSEEVVQPDRPQAALAGEVSNRYAGWLELLEGYRCDDIDQALAVLPTRASLLNIVADLGRLPGAASASMLDAADQPDNRLVDGYLFQGRLCSLRLVNRPGELSLSLGWYVAVREQLNSWSLNRLLSALRELGYDPTEQSGGDRWEQRFEGAGFGCVLSIYRGQTEASVDLECQLGARKG